jgi:hypothetical protein
MSLRHLSCPACRIRMHADAPEIALLEDRCPICEALLRPASSAAGVMGFRSFDLDALAEQEPDRVDAPDTDRWSVDGANIASKAVAKWPAAR